MTEPLLIVISGPSGAGKGTVCEELIRRHPEIFPSVSCTTRAVRGAEVEGINYFFKSEEEFEEMVLEDAFLEHAGFYGHRYGTPKTFVEDTLAGGHDCLLEIDPQGAMQVLARRPDAVSIYIMPPSMAELHRRLSSRATDTPEKIATRFAASRQEMGMMLSYRYAVLNAEVSDCVTTIETILAAERYTSQRQRCLMDILKEDF